MTRRIAVVSCTSCLATLLLLAAVMVFAAARWVSGNVPHSPWQVAGLHTPADDNARH
jgi:hypothetical protein